jgi:guanylate kinase
LTGQKIDPHIFLTLDSDHLQKVIPEKEGRFNPLVILAPSGAGKELLIGNIKGKRNIFKSTVHYTTRPMTNSE